MYENALTKLNRCKKKINSCKKKFNSCKKKFNNIVYNQFQKKLNNKLKLCATDEACALIGSFFFLLIMTLIQLIILPIDLFLSNKSQFINKITGISQLFATILATYSVLNADRLNDLWWMIVYNLLWLLKNILFSLI